MSAKQDRVAPRTAEDIERRTNYGKSYAEVLGIATDARKTAEQASDDARQCHSEIIELADSITLKVTGGEAGNTASIVLTVGDQEYSGQINLTGLVTFESLQKAGETTINGSNIVSEGKNNDGEIVRTTLNTSELRMEVDTRGNGSYENTTSLSTLTGATVLRTLLGMLIYGAEYTDIGTEDSPTYIAGSNVNIVGHTTSLYSLYGALTIGNTDNPLILNGKTISAGPINPGKKVLFTGNVAKGGSFTVPNTANYDLFAIKVSMDSAKKPGVILAYKDGNTIHGMGGWGGDDNTRKETYWVSITFSGNVWTLVHGSRHDLSLATGAWSVGTAINVVEVTGVI